MQRKLIPLFEPVAQWEGLGPESESTFEFLQRGGRPEAIPIRTWVEDVLHGVVTIRQAELKQRLKARPFENFIGAYFELQLHEMFRCVNCSFEYQPTKPENYPADFRLAEDGVNYGCEAKTFVGKLKRNEEDFVGRVRKQLKEALLRYRLSLYLQVKGELEGNVAEEKVGRFIEQLRRAACSPNESGRQPGDSPDARVCHGKWKCEGHIRSSGGEGGHTVGPGRFDEDCAPQSIRKKLHKKQSRWRNKNIPGSHFLLATSFDFQVDPSTVETALYGPRDPNEKRQTFVPDLHRSNAVIVLYKAALGSEPSASVQLYRNGDNAIPDCLGLLTQRQPLRNLIGM